MPASVELTTVHLAAQVLFRLECVTEICRVAVAPNDANNAVARLAVEVTPELAEVYMERLAVPYIIVDTDSDDNGHSWTTEAPETRLELVWDLLDIRWEELVGELYQQYGDEGAALIDDLFLGRLDIVLVAPFWRYNADHLDARLPTQEVVDPLEARAFSVAANAPQLYRPGTGDFARYLLINE
ncbi:hypothetical protein HJC99_04695 [Candidatus Saccharibacteria bacterium]|nr:hypothetical protein [Candidatus Saccharibacteria bacterium]